MSFRIILIRYTHTFKYGVRARERPTVSGYRHEIKGEKDKARQQILICRICISKITVIVCNKKQQQQQQHREEKGDTESVHAEHEYTITMAITSNKTEY